MLKKKGLEHMMWDYLTTVDHKKIAIFILLQVDCSLLLVGLKQ